MAKFARSGRRKKLTEEEVVAIFERAQRQSFTHSSDTSADESNSSFWESSDDDVSLSGHSSRSDSELISDFDSEQEEKQQTSKPPLKRKRSD